MQNRNPSTLELLSIVIPAKDEEGCIESTIRELSSVLNKAGIHHEIVVVDDQSKDRTWDIINSLKVHIPQLVPLHNTDETGFGRAIRLGLDKASGDAMVIMMGDASDDCNDVVRYWEELKAGADCVFGSRFIEGSKVQDYPVLKLFLNRFANFFIRLLFNISLNDTTNAFKAYRREVIEGCQPILSHHFNLTVELPLKAIVRGYNWKTIPISWYNRKTGFAKLKIREMGSRYFFICAYIWLEKHFSRGDYYRRDRQHHKP